MKSFKDFISEEFHSYHKSPFPDHKGEDSKGTYPIFKNPSKDEMREIAGETGKIRAILHKDGNMYAWNSDAALHKHVTKKLGFDENDVDNAFVEPKSKHLLISTYNHTKESLFGKTIKHPYLNSDHAKTTLKNYNVKIGSLAGGYD